MPIDRAIPVRYCRDKTVQRFVEKEVWDLANPYHVAEFTKTPGEVIDAAYEKFGKSRVKDLAIWLH